MSWIADAALEAGKIATGGVLASYITLFVNGRRQDGDLRRSATSLAVRLVPIFELYARSCADIRGQHQHERYNNGDADDPYEYSWIASIPAAPTLPTDDQGWRALDPELGARTQGFYLLVHSAKQAVTGSAENGDADDIGTEVEQQAATLGLKAHELARALIDKYHLVQSEMPWDYAQHFEDEIARVAEHWDRQRRSNHEMMERMWAAADSTTVADEGPGPSA